MSAVRCGVVQDRREHGGVRKLPARRDNAADTLVCGVGLRGGQGPLRERDGRLRPVRRRHVRAVCRHAALPRVSARGDGPGGRGERGAVRVRAARVDTERVCRNL